MNAMDSRDHFQTMELRYAELTESASKLRVDRDVLATRVRILEAALGCIEYEAELPQSRPDLSFIAVQRIGSVARQVLESEPAPPASTSRLRVRR